MINELFCLMSDYLPEELEGLKQTHLTSGDEIYNPNPGKSSRKYITKHKDKSTKTSKAINGISQHINVDQSEPSQKQSKHSEVFS
jgi:hypothetical protein